MFNHLCIQGKIHICHIYLSYSSQVSIFIPACGRYIWEISQVGTSFWVKILLTQLANCGLQLKFQFLPHLSIKSIFSNMVCAGYLWNFTFGPILCSNLWLVVLPNGKFLLFLSLFGTLAIKAMAFCEISISSQQNLPFLKHIKGVM